MSKNTLILSGILFIVIAMISCHKEPTTQSEVPVFLKTEMGGCNQKSSALDETIIFTNDTVIVTLQNDTLHFFTGLNYICCAPFVTDYKFSNDSISLYIIDTCNLASGSCYCRCSCYYTFDFYLNDISDKKYFWKVILKDPQEVEDRTIDMGEFVVSNHSIVP